MDDENNDQGPNSNGVGHNNVDQTTDEPRAAGASPVASDDGQIRLPATSSRSNTPITKTLKRKRENDDGNDDNDDDNDEEEDDGGETQSSSSAPAMVNSTAVIPTTSTPASTTTCGECGALIQNSSNLVVHMRRHIQYRPCHCSLCDYQGYDGDDVRRHGAREHVGQTCRVLHRSKIDMEAQVREMVQKCKTTNNDSNVDVVPKIGSPENFSLVSSTSPSSCNNDATTSSNQVTSAAKSLAPVNDQRQAAFGVGSTSHSSIFGNAASSFTNPLSAGTVPNLNQYMTSGPRVNDMLSGLIYAAISQMDLDSMKCGLCGDSVPHNPVPIIRHLKVHSQFGGYMCAACDDHNSSPAAKNIGDFECHLLNVHGRTLNAERCQSILTSARKLVRQEMTRLVETAFWGLGQMAKIKCNLCNEKILWRSTSLMAHLKEHVGFYPYKCLECSAPFIEHSLLIEHYAMQHAGVFPVLCHINDTKSEREIDNTFDKCFPMLSASFIEDLEPEHRKQKQQSIFNLSDLERRNNLSTNHNEGIDNGDLIDDDCDSLTSKNNRSDSVIVGLNAVKSTVTCNLCDAKISRNMSCLIAHAKVHLAYKPLKCDYCSFRHFAMSKIRRHNARVHSNKPVKVSYHPVQDIGKQIKEMKLKCFGLLANQSLSTTATSGNQTHGTNAYSDDAEMAEDDEAGCWDVENNNNNICTLNDNLTTALPVDTGCGNPVNQSPPMATVADLLKGLISASNPLASAGALFLSPNSKSSSVGNNNNNNNKSSNEIPYEGSGLGKKLCKMCNTYIANNPSSFENHACKHLDYKPYNCQYCQYQSYIRGKVTRHIQQVHSGLAVKIFHNPVQGIKDQINRVKLQCFPFLSGTLEVGGLTLEALGAALTDGADDEYIDGSPTNSGLLCCKLCNGQVPADHISIGDHVETHIVTKFYYCPLCTYQTPQLPRAKQHVLNAHPNNCDQQILVCPADGPAGLQALRVDCFGADAIVVGRSKKFGNGTKNEYSDDEDETSNKEILDEDDSVDDCPLPVSTGEEVDEAGRMEEESSLAFDGKLRCELCSEMVLNQQNELNMHARQHIDYKPYQCSCCNWKSTNESDVKQHILNTHRNAPIKVIYHPEKAMLNKIQLRCFPSVSLITLIKGESSRSSTPTNNSHLLSTVGRNQSSQSLCSNNSSAPTFANNPMRRLTCKLCSGTIADNPKSVGIHVKNHLNYKPYRCPYCRYMSCEQSKARRHVEHVHNVSGDTIEIHAEDNIKEKINDMKSRCFPNLGQLGLMDVYGNGSILDSDSLMGPPASGSLGQMSKNGRIKSQLETYKEEPNLTLSADDDETSDGQSGIFSCTICKEPVPMESVDVHVRQHLGKAFKCAYCTGRFWSEDKVKQHVQTIHPYSLPKFLIQESDLDSQFLSVKKTCFPNVVATIDDQNGVGVEQEDVDDWDSPSGGRHATSSRNDRSSEINARKMATPVDGRLACMVCDQWVSMNPNSLDVHVKNHLEFKPHSCSSCTYKSCIAGKVKRHLDSVHRGKEARVISFLQTSQNLKQVIADMRSACFPMMEGDVQVKSRSQTVHYVEQLRNRLTKELKLLGGESAYSGGGGLSAFGNDLQFMDGGASSEIFIEPNVEETNGPSSDQMDNSLLSFGEGDEDELSYLENGISIGGKLTCAICMAQIADNPSSLGLHVRNHLDYKPFHCNLCEYKSCIQAKVKRHLRNVHKSPTDQMTYNPLPDIRIKVTEMKLRCFPRMAADGAAGLGDVLSAKQLFGNPAANSAAAAAAATTAVVPRRDSPSSNRNNNVGVNNDITESDCDDEMDSYSKLVKDEQLLNRILNDKHSLTADASAFMNASVDDDGRHETKGFDFTSTSTGRFEEIECQICGERVTGDHLSKTKHLTKHLGDYEYRCQYCDYASFVQHETLKHLASVHPNQPIRVTRSNAGGKQISAAYERLTEQCFPAVGDAEKSAKSNQKIESASPSPSKQYFPLTCSLCDTNVNGYDDSAVDAHIVEHKNSTHYKCPCCSFLHCQSSAVKEHCLNEHSTDACGKIVKLNADTEGDKSVWKSRCFSSKTNGIMSPPSAAACSALDVEAGSDDLEDVDDEDLDDFEDVSYVKRKGGRQAAAIDGPRYVCQLCRSPVSMYASSLYVHVKNHMNYKPYCCGHCDYKSPVKSKVRRHIQNQHKNTPEVINYFPTPGIDHEVLRWKKKCFPEVTSFATLANDKVPCLLCKTDVADTLLSKSVHAKNHLDAKPYHCGYCSYKSCLRGETRRHVVRQHAGQMIRIEFKDDEVAVKDDIDEMIDRCFVTGQGNAARGESPAPISSPPPAAAPPPPSTRPVGRPRKVLTPVAANHRTPSPAQVTSDEDDVDNVEDTHGAQQQSKLSIDTGAPSVDNVELKCDSPVRKSNRSNAAAKIATVSPSGYNLRNTRSSTGSSTKSVSSKDNANSGSVGSGSVKLGQAYREWYCCYCAFKAHSKYVVKQHCLNDHPGKPVEVSDQNRVVAPGKKV